MVKKSRIYKILNHTFKSLASQELEKKIKVVSKRRSELLIAREMDKAQQQKAEVSVTLTEKCVVPENIHMHTKEGGKGGGGGLQKSNFFKGKYGTEMEFPERMGLQAKQPSLAGVWIFSGTTRNYSQKKMQT